MKKSFYRIFAPLPLFLSLEMSLITVFPETSIAELSSHLFSQKLAGNGEVIQTKVEFKPPKVGAPENRRGGASRGGCNESQKPLKALLPTSNLGLTTEKYPTFFVYIPSTSLEVMEFELHEVANNEETNNQVVYKTSFPVPKNPGIFNFSLPHNQTLKPLEVGKNYHWFFSIVCDPQDRSDDLLVDGWVQRIEPSPTLVNKLAKAAPRDRPALYAEAGIWYETLKTLAELRYSYPQDKTLVTDWEQLLESVELKTIAKEPLATNTILKK